MIFRRLSFLLAIVAVLGASSAAVAQGRLGGLRDDVRQPPENDDDDDDHHSSPSSHHDDHHSSHGHHFHDPAASLILWTVTSPWWLPHMALGDDLAENGYFDRYPYEIQEGYLFCGAWPQDNSRAWSGRFRAEYGNEFDDLSHIGGHLLLDTAPRLGLDSEFFYRQENLAGGGHDDLWTGDFNIVYRFAQSERVTMRSGLGVNWLSDSIGTDYGFNFTYDIDIFPCRPWIFSSTIDWGKLGDATLFHFRSTAGVNIRNMEIYIGYDHYNVGDFETDTLISGLRFWF